MHAAGTFLVLVGTFLYFLACDLYVKNRPQTAVRSTKLKTR
jgi:hypothetical protein